MKKMRIEGRENKKRRVFMMKTFLSQSSGRGDKWVGIGFARKISMIFMIWYCHVMQRGGSNVTDEEVIGVYDPTHILFVMIYFLPLS